MKSRKYPTAEEAYIQRHAECVAEIELLSKHIFDLPAPSEETNWSHVDEARRVLAALRSVTAILDGHQDA